MTHRTDGFPVVGRGDCFEIARDKNVVVIHVWGDITDPVSDAWRAATQATFDADGYPPFAFMDALDGNSIGSLQGKLRSAAFMRRSAHNIKRIAIAARGQGSFVVKTVMRAAGVANVELVSPTQAAAVLLSMKDGVDPFVR